MDTNRIAWEKTPLFYEMIFDEKKMSISFSLCPKANDYFVDLMGRDSPMNRDHKSQHELSPFVFPVDDSWGFGNVFRRNKARSVETGWITWECLIPFKATSKDLGNISGSIQCLASLMELFGFENVGVGSEIKKQFMTIDGMIVASDNCFGSGGFIFSFARPVLEFCNKIWIDDNVRNGIMMAMAKTWMHLDGKKRLASWEKYSFRISECQSDSRLVSLTCPGNCA